MTRVAELEHIMQVLISVLDTGYQSRFSVAGSSYGREIQLMHVNQDANNVMTKYTTVSPFFAAQCQ